MDVKLPDGTVIQGVPDGTTKADLVAKLKGNGMAVPSEWLADAAPKQASVKAGEAINSIPRQIGLTARYGLEGLAGAAQIGTEPIRYVTDRLTGNVGKTVPLGVMATRLSDWLGFPSPQTPDERVIGDAARLIAGVGGFSGAAGAPIQLAKNVILQSPVAKVMGGKLTSTLSANPVQQAVSAGVAGLSGGSVREAGGGQGAQLAASLGAGIAAPMAGNALVNAGSKAISAVKVAMTPRAVIDQQIDQQISMVLKQQGIDWAGVATETKQAMRDEVGKALAMGQRLDPEATARMLQFKMVPGTQPTRGMISQDPVQITREKNLAKVGANSTDIGLQTLPNLESSNTAALLRRLDNAGAAGAPDAFEAGQSGVNALQRLASTNKSRIDAMYRQARDSSGRQVVLDGPAATRQINEQLARDLVGKLPPEVDAIINKITTGETPLTVDYQQQLVKMLYRKIKGSADGDMRHGLGIVRKFLDEAEPIPNMPNPGNLPGAGPVAPGAQAGQEAIDAFKAARGANREWMQQVERTPALKAVVDGVEPDQFVSKYITGSGATVADVQELAQAAKGSPQALQAIKQHLVAHLRSAATGQAGDINKFKSESFNNALNKIGERKLAVFFSPEEIQKLRAVGNVANYASAQPAGTAVNNSNSGALMAAKALDVLDAIAGKLPLGFDTMIQGTVKGVQQRQALNAGNAITAPASPPNKPNPLLSIPSIAAIQRPNDR